MTLPAVGSSKGEVLLACDGETLNSLVGDERLTFFPIAADVVRERVTEFLEGIHSAEARLRREELLTREGVRVVIDHDFDPRRAAEALNAFLRSAPRPSPQDRSWAESVFGPIE